MSVLVRRLVGIVRVVVHLVRGVVLMLGVMPRVEAERRRAIIESWSRHVLDIFGLTLRLEGELHRAKGAEGSAAGNAPGPLLMVGNHISWIDIYAYLSVADVRFVAKSEVARWPLIGWFAARLGTIFVERDRPRDAVRVGRELDAALAEGHTVCLFPEGTTTDGSVVLPFSSVLLDAAVRGQVPVQPVSIAYKTLDGQPCRRLAFTGNATLAGSIWALAGGERSVVELRLLPPIVAEGMDRRALARQAEDAIRARLGHAPRTAAGASGAPDEGAAVPVADRQGLG